MITGLARLSTSVVSVLSRYMIIVCAYIDLSMANALFHSSPGQISHGSNYYRYRYSLADSNRR